LQRSSPAILLFFYLFTFASRLRLARSSFLIIFFSADNMFVTALAIPVRPAAGQTTIGNNKAPSSLSRSRKLLLSGHKVDKTVPRLRRG
jgi:hypothetical protein